MDPNAALDHLRDAMARYKANDDPAAEGDFAEELVTAFGALDRWLSRGGFLPDDWSR